MGNHGIFSIFKRNYFKTKKKTASLKQGSTYKTTQRRLWWGLQKAVHHLRVQVQKDRGDNNVQHLCQIHKWPLHPQSNPEIAADLFSTLPRQAEDGKLGNWPALRAGAYWRDYQAREMNFSTLHCLAGKGGSSPPETRDDTTSPTKEVS